MNNPMALTAAQVRRACALLRWGSPTLSDLSGVAYAAIAPVWSQDSVEALPDRDLQAIRTLLEGAGVRFELDAEGRPSATLAKPVT